MKFPVPSFARTSSRTRAGVATLLLLIAGQGLLPNDALAQATPAATEPDLNTGGPIRLRQPTQPVRGTGRAKEADLPSPAASAPAAAAAPGEFERHVSRLVAPDVIRRFGSELLDYRGDRQDVQDFNPLVPPDYVVQPGDEVVISIWGSVDADLRLTVDRSGRISLPRVGTVLVAGVRYADLSDVIGRRVTQVFRNYQLSVGLGQLRGVRVYVTGFVNRPGAVNVSSLSTVVGVLFSAGGPSTAGSLRTVQLRRGRDLVSTLDIYDLLLKGDRSNDRLVQAEDVIHVGPVGPQVALVGSVNRPAIFELRPNETVAELLRMAGGFSAVADRSRLYVERLAERNISRVAELTLPAESGSLLQSGDVVRALSAVEMTMPLQLKNKRVRIEGEVQRPGELVLPANATVSAALEAAGGLTASAYLYGTELNRQSVLRTQQENYERVLRDLETEVVRQSAAPRALVSSETSPSSRILDGERLLERLRALKPTGRIVLELNPDSTRLPELLLEDGDRLYVPPRSSTVGVFGSVFNAGSYLFMDGRPLDDYLHLAGGPTKGADQGSSMVVRANGSVVSMRQRPSGWFSSGKGLTDLKAQPGDTIFVPEELNRPSFVQSAKDWTTIFYNLGLGGAAIKAVFN